MFMHIEHELFWQPYLPQLENLLDIGCGTAAYLSELHRRYPHIAFTGIESNDGLVALARKRTYNDIQLVHSRYEDYQPKQRYTAMLLRLVIQHIPNRLQLLSWIDRYLEPGGFVFIIDFADENFTGDILLPRFTALFHNLRASLYQHRTFLTMRDTIRLEYQQRDFALLDTHYYNIDAHNPVMKQHMLAYMHLVSAQYGNQAQRDLIVPELEAWSSNTDGSLALPMFGMVFQKQ